MANLSLHLNSNKSCSSTKRRNMGEIISNTNMAEGMNPEGSNRWWTNLSILYSRVMVFPSMCINLSHIGKVSSREMIYHVISNLKDTHKMSKLWNKEGIITNPTEKNINIMTIRYLNSTINHTLVLRLIMQSHQPIRISSLCMCLNNLANSLLMI
jgi:hypothetical protein